MIKTLAAAIIVLCFGVESKAQFVYQGPRASVYVGVPRHVQVYRSPVYRTYYPRNDYLYRPYWKDNYLYRGQYLNYYNHPVPVQPFLILP